MTRIGARTEKPRHGRAGCIVSARRKEPHGDSANGDGAGAGRQTDHQCGRGRRVEPPLQESRQGGRAAAAVLARAARTEQQRIAAAWLRDYLRPGSPGAEFGARLARQLHPNVRRHFLATFVANLVMRDPELSLKFKQEHGVGPPSLLAISPSMRCNLRCTGCYAGEYDRKDDMSAELFERVISEAEQIGTRFFVLLGGEPFMWPPLLDVLERHPDSAFQVYTNATLIDDALARRIVAMGNIAPAVSIEGDQEHTDRRRGKGVYEQVVAAMERLRDHGALFSISVTATRDNLADVTSDAFIDRMIDLGAVYGWYFMYVPIGLDPDLDYMLTPADRLTLRREVQRLRREKPILLADFWHDGTIAGGCLAAGRRYLHINNKGDVEPCVFCHFAVDNLREVSLVEALSSDFFRHMRRLQPFGDNLLLPCPLVDHPGVMRTLVEEHRAYATHPGAESLVTDLQAGLRERAVDAMHLFAPVWREEYAGAAAFVGSDEGVALTTGPRGGRRRRARGRRRGRRRLTDGHGRRGRGHVVVADRDQIYRPPQTSQVTRPLHPRDLMKSRICRHQSTRSPGTSLRLSIRSRVPRARSDRDRRGSPARRQGQPDREHPSGP